MFPRLTESLAATEALSQVFSDDAVLQAMLDFEAALARAEARVGLIPEDAAATIAGAAVAEGFDTAELVRQSAPAGTPAVPLVRMLTERVRARSVAAAGFVHWGAASQDVTDTALVLLLGRCRPLLEADHHRLSRALRRFASEHAGTCGLEAAGWLGAILRGWSRVSSRFEEARYLQFGGPGGTLAELGDRGLAVSQAVAEELRLQCPDAPWHGYRDRLAALMAALSIYTASLGKMALDAGGRGGSSTLPHQRNPAACLSALEAAGRTPGMMSNFLAAMVREHEPAVGGWQAEWPAVQAIVQAAGVALEAMAKVAEGLTVDAGSVPKTGSPCLGSAEVFRLRLLDEKE
jgi:3-carboxy-cis,cis-muconate cycloisomerase